MVKRSEIIQLSKTHNVPLATIDKDWALGHLLNALYSFDDFSNNFVFKGGTCLRKCYYEDYRFSEDLDFTLLDKSLAVDESLIIKYLVIAEKNSGIKYGKRIVINNQTHNDQPQGYEIVIPFWGIDHKPNQKPLPENRWQTKIKIDISFSEKIILKPEQRQIFHLYSDIDTIRNKVPVYPIYEIAAEKLRALMQRNRPRDIYDLYFLSGKIDSKTYSIINKLLRQKSKNKNIECCNLEDFVNPVKSRKNKRAWDNSLGHHLPKDKLIDFDLAYNTVSKFVSRVISS